MKERLKFAFIVLVLALPLLASAQLRDSSGTVVSLGIYRSKIEGFSVGTTTIERNISPRLSALASIGLNPFSRKNYIFPIWNFDWNLFFELRYYFALRQRLLMSGFYAGILLSYNHQGLYYDHTMRPYMRNVWSSIGPQIGYQQVIARRIVVGGGIIFGLYRRQVEEGFDPQGCLRSRYISTPNYNYSYLPKNRF